MTRKDYRAIAAAIRIITSMPESEQMEEATYFDGAADCAAAVADALAEDNPNFNRTLFMKACGIED